MNYFLTGICFLLLCIGGAPAATAQPTAGWVTTTTTRADEQFRDNQMGWWNSSYPATKCLIDTAAGTLTLGQVETGGWYLSMNYALNQQADFSVVAEVQGSGGLVWGRQNSAYNLLEIDASSWHVKARREDETTKFAAGALPAASLAGGWHVLRVARRAGQLRYEVDGQLVREQPWAEPPGSQVGFYCRGPQGQLVVRHLLIQHLARPIRLAPNLPATLRRERLGPPVSDAALPDLGPQISADGRRLFFHRVLAPVSALNSNIANRAAFVAERQPDGQWGPAQPLGSPINNGASNAPVWTSPDGRELLLQSRYNPDGSFLWAAGLSRTHQQADGTWTVPVLAVTNRTDFAGQRFNYCFNTGSTVRVTSRQLTADSREADLFVEFRQPNGSFGDRRSLGPTLNTPFKELSPFLAPDDVTLYFASSGHPGYGREDIFVSRRLDDSWTNWSEPLNLGPAVNTTGSEAFFTLAAAGDYAYLSATAPTGNSDIFRLKLPPSLAPQPTRLVRGRVLDARTGQPVPAAQVAYEQLPTGREAGTVAVAAGSSRYEIVLPGGSEFGFRASAPGYFSVNENVNLTDLSRYDEVEQDLLLLPLAVPIATLATAPARLATPAEPARLPSQVQGIAVVPAAARPAEEHLTLNNVFFVQGLAVLLPGSFPELNRLAQTLADNPRLQIRLDGHTDNTGDAKDPKPNQVLSEQRVAAVSAYLVKHGVAAARLSTKGYGGSRPVAPNDTEAHKAQNRRVEFVILKH